jgi:hypothetical protein
VRLVEGGYVEAAFARQQAQQIAAVARFREGAVERRHQRLALAGSDHIGERRQRFGIDEGYSAANDDERMARGALDRVARHAGEAEEREDVDVVPFERDGKRDDVEVPDRGLRLEREQWRPGGDQFGKLLLGRQKKPFAHDVRFGVEEAIHRLQAEIGHADPVGIREGQGDAQTGTMRLGDEANFFRECELCALALCPGVQRCPGIQWCGRCC